MSSLLCVCVFVCVWRGDRSGKSKERLGAVGGFGWAFVSVALHTLNQMSMSYPVVAVCLELLGGFLVGEGETGATP